MTRRFQDRGQYLFHMADRILTYDPHFGFRLWLQTRCAGRVLWAYNRQHLEFLRDFVSAMLRERAPNANATLASRLPAWIKKAANRSAVLKAAGRLEGRLDR